MIEFTSESIWASGFWFGRLLIIDSISLLDISLFRFFISCVSFGILCISRIFFQKSYQTYGHRVFNIFFYFLFNVHEIYRDNPLYFCDISNLCLHSFFFVGLVRGLSVLMIFSKNQILVLLIGFLIILCFQLHWVLLQFLLFLLFCLLCIKFVLFLVS